MTDNFIQLNKSDVLRLNIRTDEGKETGEYLEFDLEDIELPLRYQELLEKDKRNRENLRNQMLIIDKREDVKGKKLLTKNQEDKIKVLNEFFVKEVEVYNMFLGPRGVEKLLNGRRFTWNTLDEIDDIIEKQIAPKLDISMDRITNKVKAKYSQAIERNKEKIEVVE